MDGEVVLLSSVEVLLFLQDPDARHLDVIVLRLHLLESARIVSDSFPDRAAFSSQSSEELGQAAGGFRGVDHGGSKDAVQLDVVPSSFFLLVVSCVPGHSIRVEHHVRSFGHEFQLACFLRRFPFFHPHFHVRFQDDGTIIGRVSMCRMSFVGGWRRRPSSRRASTFAERRVRGRHDASFFTDVRRAFCRDMVRFHPAARPLRTSTCVFNSLCSRGSSSACPPGSSCTARTSRARLRSSPARLSRLGCSP
mmetsp:Transcript_6319/g.39391  ORF Transcript_6319/g.39391 Transcript_6319/m.39391 type:complete len:250 (-) Transcript_6319:2491-3240(-)